MPEHQKLSSSIVKLHLSDATFEFANDKDSTIEPNFVNFFFGKNGSGKTTIGRQIRSDTGIEYDPDMPRAAYDVLVYNQDFIEENFRTYDGLKGVFTISEDAVKDSKEIDAKESRKRECEKNRSEASSKLTTNSEDLADANQMFSDSCWKSAKDLREAYKKQLKGSLRATTFSQKVLETKPEECDLKDLETLYRNAFAKDLEQYLPFDSIKDEELNIPSCSLLEEPIVSRSETDFARFVKALKATDWVKQGHDRFHDGSNGKCPYCQQTLPSTFEEDIAACFDEQYLSDIESVSAFRTSYREYMMKLYYIFNGNLQKKLLPTLNLDQYRAELALFQEVVKGNLAQIDAKISQPATIVQIEDVTNIILDMSSITQGINDLIAENNKAFREKKNNIAKFGPMLWGMIAYRLKGVVEAYRKKLSSLDKEQQKWQKQYDDNNNEIIKLTREIAELGKTNHTILTVINDINELLSESGFEGFHIERSDLAKNTYRIVRQDGQKTIVENLSEGERNFIAFLYFYQIVKRTQSEDGITKDKIVVIDDPISSMDSNALFIISALVREMVEVCYNNVEYRNREMEGDYIKQLFILTHNAYFHKVITYNQVNRYRGVNFYLVDKVNNISSVELCDKESTTHAGLRENVNPVKNSYAALWSEYSALSAPIPLMNVMHRILDYYFLELSGYDGLNMRKAILVDKKDKFIVHNPDGTEDRTKYQAAQALLSYIAAGISDDLHFVSTSHDCHKLREVFKMIFDELGQGQHYTMMIERSRV